MASVLKFTQGNVLFFFQFISYKNVLFASIGNLDGNEYFNKDAVKLSSGTVSLKPYDNLGGLHINGEPTA